MNKITNYLFLWFIKLCFVWVVLAFIFQITMLILTFTNPTLERKISNELMWKIDGTFNK